MRARALSILGTGSHVGKSLVTAGLCRVFAEEGVRVTPFKAQNMALNAYVTPDGGEIGYSQALQAKAARIVPTVDINPILIKPEGERVSQLIVHGRAVGKYGARDFLGDRSALFEQATRSYDRLAEHYDVVLIEGAGSPVELNLIAGDLANLRMARYADASVLLVGDIERGGIFAALYGTIQLLESEDRKRVKGLLVNKFRGDPSLFAEGIDLLRKLTGTPVLGVLPYRKLNLPEEDSMALTDPELPSQAVSVAVVRFPSISNFTDFDALRHEPEVDLGFFLEPPHDPPALVILPGSKNTISDLLWMYRSGWVEAIKRFQRAGSLILGICGGFQMLGDWVSDPDGAEGPRGRLLPGLSLIPAHTVLLGDKTTRQIDGTVCAASWPKAEVSGYEIHQGVTEFDHEVERRPFLRLNSGQEDGWCSEDGQVLGTYVHGLFDHPSFRQAFLERLGMKSRVSFDPVERAIQSWEEVIRRHVDVRALFRMAGI